MDFLSNCSGLIANLGFPIFVALFVLFRLEKTIKENTQTIRDLNTLILNFKK